MSPRTPEDWKRWGRRMARIPKPAPEDEWFCRRCGRYWDKQWTPDPPVDLCEECGDEFIRDEP